MNQIDVEVGDGLAERFCQFRIVRRSASRNDQRSRGNTNRLKSSRERRIGRRERDDFDLQRAERLDQRQQ